MTRKPASDALVLFGATGDLANKMLYPALQALVKRAGRYDVKVLADGWTAVTKDKSLSAQFEHTIGVTDTGVEIFTQSSKGFNQPPYPH